MILVSKRGSSELEMGGGGGGRVNSMKSMSQFKYLRKCHHQKYYQGPPQSKVLSGTATIKTNDRECRNKTYPGSANNRNTTREYAWLVGTKSSLWHLGYMTN